MESNAQEHLTEEISRVIDRFRKEYEMSYIDLVGTLEYLKQEILLESFGFGDDEADGEFIPFDDEDD